MKNISFTIPGIPVAKQRARTTKKGFSYTPKETVQYENLVKLAFSAVKPDGFQPLDSSVEVLIHAFFPMPKSAPRAVKNNLTRPKTTRPDLDNVVKSVFDGLNGVAWVDDARVYRLIAVKTETLFTPELTVTISWEE